MADSIQRKGQCLCGKVLLDTKVEKKVGVCHCGMCRAWGGGPMFAVQASEKPHFEGSEHINSYDTSDWAERAFCQHCGSHLYYRIKASDEYIVPVGLFRDQSGFELDHQIFIDHKPDYYAFANDTTNMTEAEVFAKYS